MVNTHRKPPIQYLTAFASAARHKSFKTAARELNVSPSAISQQIKTLETFIGLPLFSRKKRELQLTRAGKTFYQIAEKTIATYELGYTRFAERYASPSLKVSMIPYVANELVIPQLYHFQESYPEIELVVETSTQIKDLASSDLDAAIRFGIPPWGDDKVELISTARSNLVATQSYFNKNPIKTVSDWQNQTLIHTRTGVNDWQRFMDQSKIQFKPQKELYFDSYSAGIRAAEEGLGIAIGVFPLTRNKVIEGNLTTLSGQYSQIEESFYLVSKTNENKQESYGILLAWLRNVFSEV